MADRDITSPAGELFPSSGVQDSKAGEKTGGERADFDKLAESLGPRLYRAACRLTGNAGEAEEMAQEAIVKGFLSADRFRGESNFYTYLYRILLNLWRNRLRSRSRWKWVRFRQATDPETGGLVENRIVDPGPDPHQAFEARQRADRVQAALGALPPSFREILVLREAEGLDYNEIARVLGLTPGTVRSRLSRARGRLRKLLEKD